MQPGETQVEIRAGTADEGAGATIGHGQLVARDRVVLVLDDRASAPALPLHVLVPVAAGGGRGEHLDVAEIERAPEGVPCVGLRLERPAQVQITGEPAPPEQLRRALDGLEHRHGGDGGGGLPSVASGLLGSTQAVSGDPWWCKLFPRWCS